MRVNATATVKTVNGTTVDTKKPVVEEPKVVEEVKPVEIVEEPKKEEPVVEAAKPAVVFGEKVPSQIENVSPVYEIEKALETIMSNITKIDIKEVKTDLEDRMFDKLINSDVDKTSLGRLLIKLLSKVAEGDNEIISGPTMINELIEKYYDLVAEYSEDNKKINISLRTRNTDKPKDVLYLIEDAKKSEPVVAPVEEKEEEEINTGFSGIAWYSGKRINTSEIMLGLEENYDAIVISDENGNYLKDSNNFMIALDYVDNVSLDDCDIVSKSWLVGMIAENEAVNKNPFEKEEEKSVPVGALPQEQTEDTAIQKAMEDFVKNEQ